MIEHPNSLTTPRRLLVRAVNWLGDAVMTTPALIQLRSALPETTITLLTHDKLAPLWQRHPALDDVMVIQRGQGLLTTASRLRARRFDAALLLPNSPRTGLEVWLAGVPRRIGGAWPWRDWMLTHVVPHPSKRWLMERRGIEEIRGRLQSTPQGIPARRGTYPAEAHHLHHYLRLAAALGASCEPLAPSLPVFPEEVEAVRNRFSIHSETVWIGVNAGAEYGPAKRWPKDRFISTIQALKKSHQNRLGFLCFGGPADRETAAEIASAAATDNGVIRNLAGQTTLRELASALSCCRVVLTNDTGPMHVAAAVDTAVVVPFGSTSPELTGPGFPGDPKHALILGESACAPCFLRECPIDFRCQLQIRVETVVEAIQQRLHLSHR